MSLAWWLHAYFRQNNVLYVCSNGMNMWKASCLCVGVRCRECFFSYKVQGCRSGWVRSENSSNCLKELMIKSTFKEAQPACRTTAQRSQLAMLYRPEIYEMLLNMDINGPGDKQKYWSLALKDWNLIQIWRILPLIITGRTDVLRWIASRKNQRQY